MDYSESNLNREQHEALAALIGHSHPGSSEEHFRREKPMSMERLIGAPYGTAEVATIQDTGRTAALLASNPRLEELRVSYTKLADFNRCYQGQILSWDQIVAAIPNLSEFLTIIATATSLKPCDISAKGELVLRDGLDPKNLIKINLDLTTVSVHNF